MTDEQKICKHEKLSWSGLGSMVGHYNCRSCNLKIDPVVAHKRDGSGHVLFREGNEDELFEYLSKLDDVQLDLYNETFN
jgi:hypothetical protein